MHPALGLIVAYIAGSIPSAYLAGKLRGIDLRQHGSGNLGTTNVFRVLGPVLGVIVFLVDALKGALPVLWLPELTGLAGTGVRAELWAMAFGVMAIMGHVKPVFLLRSGGGGGKGVATATGVFAALAPAAIGILVVVFLVVLFASGYVSLAALTGAALLPPLLWLTQGTTALFWLSLGVVTFVFWAHRSNIGRLRRGEESGFRRRKGVDAVGAPGGTDGGGSGGAGRGAGAAASGSGGASGTTGVSAARSPDAETSRSDGAAGRASGPDTGQVNGEPGRGA